MSSPTDAPPIFRSPHQVPPAAPPERSGLGRAAVIVGTAALIGAVVPILNYGAWALAIAGVVLALVARHQRRGEGSPGLQLSVIAFFVSVVLAVAYTVIGTQLSSALDLQRDADAVASDSIEVTYELIGDGGPVSFEYTGHDAGGAYVSNGYNIPLPFRESIEFPPDLEPAPALFFNASVSADSSTLTCRILVGGVVVDEQTGIGEGAAVSCSAVL